MTEQLASGRYLAENGRWFVQLRVDASQGTISADLVGRDADGPCELWVKTVDVPPEEWEERRSRLQSFAPLEIDLRDGRGGISRGTLTIAPREDETLISVTFAVERPLGGLVPGIDLTVRAARVSTALRDVGLEIEREDGLEIDLNAPETSSQVHEITGVLHDAGLDIHPVGQPSVVPPPAGGTWSASDIFSELSRQVRNVAQAPLSSPAWELHLMLLSRTDRAGLLGIMFDFVDDLPRQGAAVFVGEIQDRYPTSEVSRRVLTTAVHELGHCLNLAHRFTREINLLGSTSFMNYDWIYKGGDHVDDYWRDFSYTFDNDELEFLRHAPRDQVIPGGAPFGSARYWTSVAAPWNRSPAAGSTAGLQLWLTPPTLGTRFSYGQPVFLEVSLRNADTRTHCLPRHVLDVKAGMLEILIRRRRPSSWTHTDDRESFSPFLRRCFAVDAPERTALRPGESMHDNVSLTFGSAGSPFVAPGEYVITPVLSLYDPAADDGQLVIEGADLLITIDRPVSVADERDAELLWRPDVGASLALGGAECLPVASGLLEEITDRRSRREAVSGRPDGLVAAASRTLGIQADRRGERAEADKHLRRVTGTPLRLTLDPHTAHGTAVLARRQRPDVPSSSPIFVDLAARNATGAAVAPHTVAGVLVGAPSRHARAGWPAEGLAVLFDAGSDDGAMLGEDTLAGASAVVTAADGLTERVRIETLVVLPAERVDERPLGLAVLARPVPARSVRGLPCADLWSLRTAADVRTALRRAGLDLDDAETTSTGQVSVVALAEQGSPGPIAGVDDAISPQIEQVASWIRVFCLISKRCNEVPPGQQPLPSDRERLGLLPVLGCGPGAGEIEQGGSGRGESGPGETGPGGTGRGETGPGGTGRGGTEVETGQGEGQV